MERGTFLKIALKSFAMTSLAISGVNCGSALKTPKLKGLSESEYHNMNSLGEIFLEGFEIPGFDLGLAMDHHLFGHPMPMPDYIVSDGQELAGAPSSRLAALVLDGSLTPLVALPPAERRARLLGWKHSSSKMKRGLFGIMRQTCFVLLSSSPKYQEFIGYGPKNYFEAWANRKG